MELAFLCFGSSGHSRQLIVHTEVVLDCDRGESLSLTAHGHFLLSLYSLVKAIRPASTMHLSTGELIDDDDLPTFHHIFNIFLI